MKICIWPDVHNRIDILEKFLNKNGELFNKIIFLGDFFDQFHDGPADAEKTANYLKKLIYQDNVIYLASNHDLAYAFPTNPYLQCPGFSLEKNEKIQSILGNSWREKIKLFHFEPQGDWLISHAGFSHKHLGQIGIVAEKDELLEYLYLEEQKFWRAAHNYDFHQFMEQGMRMGSPFVGGPTWCAIENFRPLKQFGQIIGHSPQSTSREISYPNKTDSISKNWCIDTCNREFAILKDGEISIEKTEKWV